MSNTCKYQDCLKTACYGINKNKIKYCKIHATSKMINLDNCICQYKNCRQKSVYGYTNSNLKKKYCDKHKYKDMDNLLIIQKKVTNEKYTKCNEDDKDYYVIPKFSYKYSAKLLFANPDFESQLFMYVI